MSCGSDGDTAKVAMLLTYAKNPEAVEKYVDSLIFKDDGSEHFGNVTGFKNRDEVENALFNLDYSKIGDKYVAVMDKDSLVGYSTGAANQEAMLIPDGNGGHIAISNNGVQSNLIVLTTTTNAAGDTEITGGGPSKSLDTFIDESSPITDEQRIAATELAASRQVPLTIGIIKEVNGGKDVIVTTRLDKPTYESNFS